jgi:hypothetical protein
MDSMDMRAATTSSDDSGTPTTDAYDSFVFERFFEGKVRGWGFFEDRFRKVRSRFDIEMTGYWHVDAFVIDEALTLDTGEVQERRWRVTVLGDGRYRAQVDDVVGLATGRGIENGVQWSYQIKVPVGGRTLVLAFDDRMYGRDDASVLNIAVAKKWGVTVGRLVATYWRA